MKDVSAVLDARLKDDRCSKDSEMLVSTLKASESADLQNEIKNSQHAKSPALQILKEAKQNLAMILKNSSARFK